MMAKKKATKANSEPALNEEQAIVAAHTFGPLRVVAVAGSGKTAAIIERAVYLVQHGIARPQDLLLISFSVNARKVMERRLAGRLPYIDASRICRTFHSIGLDIFRNEASEGRAWRIDDTGRLYTRALTMAMRQVGVAAAQNDKGKDLNLPLVKAFAVRCKTDMLVTPPALRRLGNIEPEMKALAEALVDVTGVTMAPDDLITVFHRAEDLRESGAIDDNGVPTKFVTFDDMVYGAAMLLRKPEVKARWAERWKFVMQDECQDANTVQDEIAEALCAGHRNYMVVGDPSQAVFAFRGARPDRLMQFDQHWPGTKTIVMHRNYRSGIDIIDTANRLIKHMPAGTTLPVEMHSERQTRAHVSCHVFGPHDEEADAITKNVVAHQRAGLDWKDQAILIRMNWMSRGPEIALARAGVPYRLISGTSFFGLREVAVLYGYLRLAAGRATAKDVENALLHPNKMLGRAFVEKVFSCYEQKQRAGEEQPDWLACAMECQVYLGPKQREALEAWVELVRGLQAGVSRFTPYQLLTRLKELANLDEWVAKGGDVGEDNQSAANLDEAMRFASSHTTVAGLLDEIDRIAAHRANNVHARNVVAISTIHKCVRPDTLVSTDGGLVPISTVGPRGTIGTPDGPRTYRSPVRYANRALLTITTSNGYEVTVTRDHRLMAWDGDCYRETQARHLCRGQYVRLPLHDGCDAGRDAPLPPAPRSDARARVYPLPDRITDDIAEFLGLVVADGTVYRGGFRVGKAYEDTCARFSSLARNLFGCEPYHRYAPGKRTGMHICEVNSTFLSSWLLAVGGLGPNNKSVPDVVMRSSATRQTAFLRGIFEDAAINIKPDGFLNHIGLSTSSEPISKTVQLLLLRAGFISHRFSSKPGSWRVDLYGRQASRFASEIGFASASRTAQARGARVRERSGYTIPISEADARAVDRQRFRYDRANAISRGVITRAVAEKLGRADDLRFHHDTVESITGSRGPAMCVEVPGYGRFIQNGFDGCNSKGLEWPIVYIPLCEDGLFPVRHVDSRGHQIDDIPEERRLFYVAVTRAKDELWLSYARHHRDEQDATASMFLAEADVPCISGSEFKPGRVIEPVRVGTQMELI